MTATRTIPPGDLYWAVLTHEHTARAGSQPTRETPFLDEQFAELIPVPFETVKAAYVAIDSSRILATAAPREALSSLPADTVSAHPQGLPASLSSTMGLTDLAPRLNFLHGDLEPRPVTAAKRRAAVIAAATILVLASVTLLGIERRTAALRAAAVEHRTLATAALRDLYPKAQTPDAAQLNLDQDLARFTRTRATRPSVQPDAADAVESLLSAWPRSASATDGPKLRTESLTATPESLLLTVALDDRASATPLSDSLRTMSGWHLFQPQFTASAPSASGNAGTLRLNLAPEPPASDKPKEGAER